MNCTSLVSQSATGWWCVGCVAFFVLRWLVGVCLTMWWWWRTEYKTHKTVYFSKWATYAHHSKLIRIRTPSHVLGLNNNKRLTRIIPHIPFLGVIERPSCYDSCLFSLDNLFCQTMGRHYFIAIYEYPYFRGLPWPCSIDRVTYVQLRISLPILVNIKDNTDEIN